MTGWLFHLYGHEPASKPLQERREIAQKALKEAKPRFDRVAYQREYMRKRRAKAKENASL